MNKKLIVLIAILSLGLEISQAFAAKPKSQKKAVRSYVYNGSDGIQLCKKLRGKTKITVCVGDGEMEPVVKHKIAASLKDLAFKFRLNSKALKSREKVLINAAIDDYSSCLTSLNASDVAEASMADTDLKLCRYITNNATVCVSGSVGRALIPNKHSHWVTNTITKLQNIYARKWETLVTLTEEDEEIDEEALCEYQEGIFLAANSSFEASKNLKPKEEVDQSAIPPIDSGDPCDSNSALYDDASCSEEYSEGQADTTKEKEAPADSTDTSET